MNAICTPIAGSVRNPPVVVESLAVTAARLADTFEQDVQAFLMASDQNLGDIEVQIEQQSRELLRAAAEKAAQKKADVTPPVCPVCQKPLSQVSRDHRRSFECKFGTITIGRSRGYCKRCRKWRFPADTALGLEESAGYSPRVQEMASLLATKTGWITGLEGGEANPLAAEPSSRPVGKTNAASRDQVSIGVRQVTKRSCVWKLS